MSELLNRLHEAAFTVTPLVLEEEYKHMKEPWEMILGGLIIPAMVKEDPEVLDGNPKYKELLEKYTPEKIHEYFHPEPKVIEKKVAESKSLKKGKKKTSPKSERAPITKDGEKYRRIKGKIKKVSRFARSLEIEDRNVIISYWNDRQKLVPSDDPLCEKIAKEINDACGKEPIAPAQIAGYFSHLCRIGMRSEEDRERYIEGALKRGCFSVTPEYTPDLLKEIVGHYEAVRKEEDARKKAHAKIRAARTGEPLARTEEEPIEAPYEEPPVGTAYEESTVEDETDIIDITFE